jgi:cell division protein FtsB
VSDQTNRSRSASAAPRRRLFPTVDNRFVIVAACAIAAFCILVGGHLYGRYLSARDLGGRDNAIEQLRAELQKTKRQLDAKSAEATELQAKLDKAQSTLNAIMPSQNTFNIQPNQSLIVGDGRLTVGLVGSPSNENVTLDINGKQQQVDAGQIVDVAPDPSTKCQVQVESFDMFKAVLVASCTPARPQ